MRINNLLTKITKSRVSTISCPKYAVFHTMSTDIQRDRKIQSQVKKKRGHQTPTPSSPAVLSRCSLSASHPGSAPPPAPSLGAQLLRVDTTELAGLATHGHEGNNNKRITAETYTVLSCARRDGTCFADINSLLTETLQVRVPGVPGMKVLRGSVTCPGHSSSKGQLSGSSHTESPSRL